MDVSEPPAARTVLIVEDSPVARRALSVLVGQLGWEVAAAGTLADAMRLLAERPRCVLLDLMLPDGSGAQVLRHIRQEALPVRVAVPTGTSGEHLMREVEDLRPDAVYL